MPIEGFYSRICSQFNGIIAVVAGLGAVACAPGTPPGPGIDDGDPGYEEPPPDAGTPPPDAGYEPTDPYGDGCGDDTSPDPDALLFSRRGGSPLFDYCKCRPDDEALPRDPRSIVQPGINAGRAVAFNAYWRDCHVDPEAVREDGPAQTCGELRARVWAGEELMNPSTPGGGALFSGTEPLSLEAGFGIATFPASAYNQLWTVWGGFLSRPANFDELVSERYGAPFGDTPNPYPLPGEDPNATGGGSGTLPHFFTQLRNADGTWTGTIGITCHGCHSGAIVGDDGPGFTAGSGSPLADHNLFLRDMLPLGYPASAATLANLNRTRGVNNASDVNLAFLFPEEGFHDLPTLIGLIVSGSSAGMDTPAWWNMGHRPVKFVDGMFPMDAPRVDMVFYTPITGLFGGVLGPVSASSQDWMREHGPAANDWVTILKSPEYPLPIDVTLAEQGAILFHELDLWGPDRDNPVRNPEAGNGSCASCHGAYAPRYVNDPSFLETPELEGIASYITPLDVIGTDPVRLETNGESVQRAGSASFFGYPPTHGTANDCGPQNREDLRGDRELGYLAPPLYGVWATAPYLHNGSIPNLWEILEPADRVALWQRRSSPAALDQLGQPVVMGYDTDFARAFDPTRVGWQYDEVACRRPTLFEPAVSPHLACDDGVQGLINDVLAAVYDNVIVAWNLLYPPIVTREQMEERKVYNTSMYAQSNSGHDFTSVLSDHERLAILEYLKTL